MRFKALMLTAAIATAALLTPASAGAAQRFTNGSFEDKFEGWTRSSTHLITATDETNHTSGFPPYDTDGSPYTPRDGWVHAQLTTDEPDVITLLSQTFKVSTVSVLTGQAAFLGEDYIDPLGVLFRGYAGSFNDYGFVRLSDGLTTIDLLHDALGFDADIANLGNFGSTDWTMLQASLNPGTYTLEIGVANVGDIYNDSRLIADNFQVKSLVPEPMTWALMLTGFFSMGAMLRRQRRLQPVRIPVRTRRD